MQGNWNITFLIVFLLVYTAWVGEIIWTWRELENYEISEYFFVFGTEIWVTADKKELYDVKLLLNIF